MGFFDKLREKQEEMRKAAEAKRLAAEEAKRIEEEARREREAATMRIESTIKTKMENSPLVAELLNCILNGEKWIVAGQNLDDTCIRNVEIEWDLVDIEWIGYHYERKVAQTGDPYISKEEDVLKKYSFVFAEHGYSPLKAYVDSESGIEIPMDRMCFILATIVDEHMAKSIKNYKHEAPGLFDSNYDKIYQTTYHRYKYPLHCSGRAYYRYMVPDVNSQGPLQEWL